MTDQDILSKAKAELDKTLNGFSAKQLEAFEKVRSIFLSAFENRKAEDIITSDGVAKISVIQQLGNEADKVESGYIEDEQFLTQVLSLMIKNMIFGVDENEELSVPEKIQKLKAVKESLFKTDEYVDTPSKGNFNQHYDIIDRLLNKYNTKADFTHYYYCDNFSKEKLQALHDLLVENRKLEKNLSFLDNFKDFKPDKNLRSKWISVNTELIYLCYLIFGNIEYCGEKIHRIIPRLFVNADDSELKEGNINTQFNQLLEQTDHFRKLSKGLKSIQEIFDRVS